MSGAPAAPATEGRHESTSKRRPAQPRLADPKYVRGSTPGESWAHFPSGAVVRVDVGRARVYPGLPATAPSTLPFYREACRRFASARSVLDAGAGAGTGTLELSGVFDEVIAVDADPHAVAFAKSYAPLARHVRADLEQISPVARVDRCIVADLLGHVHSPLATLRNVRGWLATDGEVLIAEPCASLEQRLLRPARRAFSPRTLENLLINAGLCVRSWVYQGAGFLALVAAPRPDDAWLDLVRGEYAVETGDITAALAAFERAEQSDDTDVATEAVFQRALALMACGRLEAAAGELMRAGERMPEDARPRAALSRIMLASESPEEALELAGIGVRLDPTVSEAAIAVALAREALGRPDVLAAWRVAHELSPDDLFAASELARLACERGDTATGIRAFERVRDYGDALPAAFYVILTRMLLAADRAVDAQIEARVAAKLAPNDPDVAELVSELRARERQHG